jgi:hypothetical protein
MTSFFFKSSVLCYQTQKRVVLKYTTYKGGEEEKGR